MAMAHWMVVNLAEMPLQEAEVPHREAEGVVLCNARGSCPWGGIGP